MTETTDLERLVDGAIHTMILTFDPEVPETHQQSVAIAKDLVNKVEASSISEPLKVSFLARVNSHLALMASEVGDHSDAERLATEILGQISIDDPNFSLAVLIRVQALHSLGRHEEEVRFGLEYAEVGGIDGQSMVFLLAELARRHPESIQWKASLISRVIAYASESPILAGRIQDSHSPLEDPEGYVLAVADALQQFSREETDRIIDNGMY